MSELGAARTQFREAALNFWVALRELVGALGGRVTVGSEIGRGSTFRIVLPARAPASAKHA